VRSVLPLARFTPAGPGPAGLRSWPRCELAPLHLRSNLCAPRPCYACARFTHTSVLVASQASHCVVDSGPGCELGCHYPNHLKSTQDTREVLGAARHIDRPAQLGEVTHAKVGCRRDAKGVRELDDACRRRHICCQWRRRARWWRRWRWRRRRWSQAVGRRLSLVPTFQPNRVVHASRVVGMDGAHHHRRHHACAEVDVHRACSNQEPHGWRRCGWRRCGWRRCGWRRRRGQRRLLLLAGQCELPVRLHAHSLRL